MVQYFSRKAYVRFLCLLVSMFAATSVWAGTEGKITGIVTSADGQPLPGVGVSIAGIRLGATTDPEGRYMIMRVPPGSHSVNAQMIGFRTTTVTDVLVRADRTTEINFTLQEEAIEVGDVVVVAEREAIEVDVTSSLTTVDAERMSEAPVTSLLDYLSYEPGVSVSAGNELSIRGGGASEIRFQVDGLDRTDALTSKAFSNLNQVLVTEVTVLTGGFNAEYGNVRSGMVNAVLKDGTERPFGLPWISGAINYAPAQQKHFGPGAYDDDQYDYWLMSSQSPYADATQEINNFGKMYWPLLYEETRNSSQFTNTDDPMYRDPESAIFKVFRGWEECASLNNARNRSRGTYGKSGRDANGGWTPYEARAAWEWEANMNEQVWEYAHQPDYTIDLAAGWALPARLGGIVVGYSDTREMTSVPALRPYYRDRMLEGKLTLTPIDELKIAISGMLGHQESTGAGSKGMSNDSPELSATKAGAMGGDPVSLRSSGQLVSTVNNASGGNNKLHLSYNGPLQGDFTQFGVTATYTLGPLSFVTLSLSRSESEWELERDLPRVDVTNFDDPYQLSSYFGYQGWLTSAYMWSDVDGNGTGDAPTSLDDAISSDRAIFRGPFQIPNVYTEVPTEGRYVTKTFDFNTAEFGYDSIPAVVVSPQGYVQGGYPDMSQNYILGTGGEVVLSGRATQTIFNASGTHVSGDHTLKFGAEYLRADLEYHTIQSSALMGTAQYTDMRDYGGDYPAAQPSILGLYAQDKFESGGMIANIGVRVERFDAGQIAILYEDMFYADVVNNHSKGLWEQAVINLGWDTTATVAGWQRWCSDEWQYRPDGYGHTGCVADAVGYRRHDAPYTQQGALDGSAETRCFSPGQ